MTDPTPKPNRTATAIALCAPVFDAVCEAQKYPMGTASREYLANAKEQLRLLRMALARAHEVSEEK